MAAALALLLAGCTGPAAGPPGPAPAASPVVLAAVPGATLTRYPLPGGDAAYLTLADVRRVRVHQVLGAAAPAGPGLYHPGAASPRFTRLTPEQARASCPGGTPFAAVNAGFFETYDPGTALSFPVKAAGRVLTGGSSRWGPVPRPRDPRYARTVLRALTWTGRAVSIGPYTPATGAPLDRPEVPDALVTYAWADHPSAALGGDPANRYQLLGVRGDHELAVLTLDRGTLAAGDRLLRAHGVTGDVLALDGGVSTYLWTPRTGTLVAPVGDGRGPARLPHYLCLTAGSA